VVEAGERAWGAIVAAGQVGDRGLGGRSKVRRRAQRRTERQAMEPPRRPGVGRGGPLAPWLVLLLGALLAACGNDPYPASDSKAKVLYGSFVDAPKSLDPAVAYSQREHAITGAVYDTLLEYHFLKRPLELIPGLAVALPEVTDLGGGRSRWRFELRPDLLFHDDPCFELSAPGLRTRQITSADFAFALARIADPKVGSPVVEPFSNLEDFQAFGERLTARRESDAAFAARPVHEQYREVGPIAGIETPSPAILEITLARPYPQIRYWFAMEFSAPIPWEAIAWYDGEEGRPRFDDHPVGSGPFQLTRYDKRAIFVLEKSANWYGVRHPEWRAPGGVYPSEGEARDRAAGRLEDAGRPLPMIDRIEMRREKEDLPRFNKFMQGYYDNSGIVAENFDTVIQNGRLTPEMEALGVALDKEISPTVFFLGFNMDDPVVGKGKGAATQARNRRLRQAMSLAIDAEEFLRIFSNGRGLPAQSPIPPNIYGHDPDYRNPYRQPDLERARAILVEAGYAGGIDPATGEALRLTFDSYNTTTAGLIQHQYYTNAWKKLGLDVRIEAVTYNQFQDKLRNGAHQIFEFGWGADYPDPENFLFLFWSAMRNSTGGGPNYANFADDRFDALFLEMKVMENGPARLSKIREMIAILEDERPWIELMVREDYLLRHGWLANVKPSGLSIPTYQYLDIDVEQRAERRHAWNQPIVWPLYGLLATAILVVVPGIRTYLKERQ
jgi:ABC-type transport system substrate-binding protein